ncbi:MAG: glycosyltransferase family 39 protein [Deltaproteobacteria bacterium]|nr:glycosyltransferase family 39 protein [Deltaproteobacteria bacterium]
MRREKTISFTVFVLVGAFAVLIVSTGILSWVPPVSKDALVHHLAVPKLYLEHGGIYEIPTMPYSYFPMNLDLLYLIPLWLGSDIAAKFIHFAFALLIAYLLFQYLRRRLGTLYALFGSLFFLSLPIIVKLSITVYVDLGVIYFSTFALLLLFRWMEQGFRLKYLVLSGIFCGLAMGTKYSGLVTFAVLGLLVPFLCARYEKDRDAPMIRPVSCGILFLLTALVVFSPWMIRNSLWKNNPVYPLYNSFFKKLEVGKGKIMPTVKIETEARQDKAGLFTYRKSVYGERWWEMALLPVRIFFQGEDGNPRFFDGKLNPFLLLLSLFAFFPGRKDPPEWLREKKILLGYAILYFVFAFFTSALRIRYISPIIPPLVILSTFGLRNLMETVRKIKGPGMGYVAHGVVLFLPALALGLNAHYMVGQFKHVKPFGYITGKVDRDEYISRYRREYPVIQYANKSTPRDAKILFLFLGKRGYYCDRDYVPDTAGQVRSLYRNIKGAKSPENIWLQLRARGITHLVVDLSIFDKWLHSLFDAETQGRAKEFFKKYLVPMYFKNGVGLYEIKNV